MWYRPASELLIRSVQFCSFQLLRVARCKLGCTNGDYLSTAWECWVAISRNSEVFAAKCDGLNYGTTSVQFSSVQLRRKLWGGLQEFDKQIIFYFDLSWQTYNVISAKCWCAVKQWTNIVLYITQCTRWWVTVKRRIHTANTVYNSKGSSPDCNSHRSSQPLIGTDRASSVPTLTISYTLDWPLTIRHLMSDNKSEMCRESAS